MAFLSQQLHLHLDHVSNTTPFQHGTQVYLASIPQVIHHVLLDECANLVYVASRENGKVIAYSIDKLEVCV